MSQQLTGFVQASHLTGTVTLDCVCSRRVCYKARRSDSAIYQSCSLVEPHLTNK